MNLEDVCRPCRAGLHDECSHSFDGTLAEDQECCCGGEFDLLDAYWKMVAEDAAVRKAAGVVGDKPAGAKNALMPGTPVVEKMRGDSGYIHPDAWPSEKNLGELTDPESTGRKRVVRMYPIETGMVCEWARRKYAGGGPAPIIGCMGNPATDQHHGPDKNTLNNAKASRGVGTTENVHLVCSDCHNAWHAANDPFYGDYDRIADQARPWLPYSELPWGPQDDSTEAPFEELVAVEKQREERRKKRGRTTRGRNSVARTDADTSITDE